MDVLLEEGSGRPRDLLQLRSDRPVRGEGEGQALVHLSVATPSGEGRGAWVFGAGATVSLPDSPGLWCSAYSFASLFCQWTQEEGEWIVRFGGLPPGEVRIPRLRLDVEVEEILGEEDLGYSLARGESLEVHFLDRKLFVTADGDEVVWGSETYGRFGVRPSESRAVQGLLGEWHIEDAWGRELTESMQWGRSWGPTNYRPLSLAPPGSSAPPVFPLRVVGRWRPCSPTATCRFVLKDIVIPAE